MSNQPDLSQPKIQRLISNQQRLRGHDTRVIFEYQGDSLVRLYVCFVKENNSKPISRSSVQVSLVDANSNPLRQIAASPGPDQNLIEAASGSATAQAMFEFSRSPGQNLLYAAVQLGEESKLFQLEDCQPIL